MTINQRNRLISLSATSKFSVAQLENAAIEYGLNFLDIIASEASRANLDPLIIVESLNRRVR